LSDTSFGEACAHFGAVKARVPKHIRRKLPKTQPNAALRAVAADDELCLRREHDGVQRRFQSAAARHKCGASRAAKRRRPPGVRAYSLCGRCGRAATSRPGRDARRRAPSRSGSPKARPADIEAAESHAPPALARWRPRVRHQERAAAQRSLAQQRPRRVRRQATIGSSRQAPAGALK